MKRSAIAVLIAATLLGTFAGCRPGGGGSTAPASDEDLAIARNAFKTNLRVRGDLRRRGYQIRKCRRV